MEPPAILKVPDCCCQPAFMARTGEVSGEVSGRSDSFGVTDHPP
jgi:hypothetical protein